MTTLRRESNTITLATFWENEQFEKYNYNPGYQRNSVWSDEKQAFLIDSILKNIPIPPIFLHQIIDSDTGKTTYNVIDGKQRLTSIIRFIKGEITSSMEDEDSPLFNKHISGLTFNDLKKEENKNIRINFWRYSIPIEYIDTSNENIIDAIFDRLNRNGESLTGQELRNAKYYGKELLNLVELLSNNVFWKTRLKNVNVKRMEDKEFISEILFYQLEGDGAIGSNQKKLDELYAKYSPDKNLENLDWKKEEEKFLNYTALMSSLDLDYKKFTILRVSHLYAIWCLSIYLFQKKSNLDIIKPKLVEFYEILRSNPDSNEYTKEYKKTMSSGTKEKGARTKRIKQLITFITN